MITLTLCGPIASIPGRVFAFITVRQTVIKAKTRPGIEAMRGPRLAATAARARSASDWQTAYQSLVSAEV